MSRAKSAASDYGVLKGDEELVVSNTAVNTARYLVVGRVLAYLLIIVTLLYF